MYAAFVDLDNGNNAFWGDGNFVTTLRSSAKPFQAIPILMSNGDDELSDEELAICCASHPGTPRHSALAASVLALSGYIPDDLVCTPSNGTSPLTHGCSGNHAAILLGAKLKGYPMRHYFLPEHPIQHDILKIISDVCDCNDIRVAVDGCGVPTFAMPLVNMAIGFANLCSKDSVAPRIPQVMGCNPELIGSETWPDVRVMKVTDGRIIGKTGADGLICYGKVGSKSGVAIKVLDGSPRALGPASIHILSEIGWLSKEELENPDIMGLEQPPIKDSRNEIVGKLQLQTL